MDEGQEQLPAPPVIKSGGINFKVILIGLPLFVLQLVAVYFITANVLLSKMSSEIAQLKETAKEYEKMKAEGYKPHDGSGGGPTALGKFVANFDDIIVNPANTGGQRLVVISMGIDLKSEEGMKEVKEKEVLVKDAAIGLLSSKDFAKLSNPGAKDTLKIELAKIIEQRIPKAKINTIYFSKYILQ
jgi:flagellar FliL protein